MRGFTLIELLVVISIIIVLSGLSLAAYNLFNEEKKLDDEAKRLVSTLSLAAKKASAGERYTTCTDNFQGYVLRVLSQTSYQLEFCCTASPSCPAGATNTVQTYSLPTNFTLSPSNLSVLFRRLTSGTNLSSDTIIRVKNNNLNPAKCIPVTISRFGQIREGTKTTTCP